MDELYYYRLGMKRGGGTGGGGGNTPSGGGDDWVIGDGKTYLHITVDNEDYMTAVLRVRSSVTNPSYVVNWGDGFTDTALSGKGEKIYKHTYSALGDYVVALEVLDENTYQLGVCNGMATYPDDMCSLNLIKKIEIGKKIEISRYAFRLCRSLEAVVISGDVASITSDSFNECTSLKSVQFLSNITQIGSGAFQNCRSIRHVEIPNGVETIESTTFLRCTSLAKVVIPDGVTNIGINAFGECHVLRTIKFPKSVMEFSNNVFTNSVNMTCYDFTEHIAVPIAGSSPVKIGATNCEIRVPAALVDEWKAATNWAEFADYIVGV